MREFRGKREDNGEWAVGYYLKICDKHKIYVPFTEEEKKFFKHSKYEKLGGRYKTVIPETVGQFTGLTDKNGKKIFEGDILDCGDRIVYVKWHDYCGTWDCDFIRYKGDKCSNGVTPAEWKYRAVVIGNIHDNPDLFSK